MTMPAFRPLVFHKRAALAGALLLHLFAPSSFAQTGGACIPVAERTTEFGCFVHAEQHLAPLPDEAVFWHIDRFANRAAAEAARERNGTVVEILGQVWLFTIAEKTWRASSGEHVADVGPLERPAAKELMATYMEGDFKPGMQSTVHRHPGTEAWFVLSGAQCLETPHGKQMGRPGGQPVIVAPGEPMLLTGVGTERAHWLVLILMDASMPRGLPADDWTPKGVCEAAAS
ncbi:cupin domain-containing protein [Caballeronia sp. Lep1P3]|uniref:cupin domain-containing protein n=1 Tax=Caballeronia sp. Lep1P3 TaxID=2878150 RepID=UPI001FD3F08D|nr:cupin domain-containing protein [Caballeronia sp. Lep1P3]